MFHVKLKLWCFAELNSSHPPAPLCSEVLGARSRDAGWRQEALWNLKDPFAQGKPV